MIDRKLKEALELAGGKAIIVDGNDYYVMMTLREFKKGRQEGLSGLTKQELVDKINNDIAQWKFSQEEEEISEVNLEEVKGVKEDEVVYEKTA